MEYLKGSCQQASGLLCPFCTKFLLYNNLITWASRPKADESALPRLQLLPYDKTPVAGEDRSPRVIDDFQSKAQLRKMVQNGCSSRRSDSQVPETSTVPRNQNLEAHK